MDAESHAEICAGLANGLADGFGLVDIATERLFVMDMLARFQCRENVCGVGFRRNADVDNLDIGIGNEVKAVFVCLDA